MKKICKSLGIALKTLLLGLNKMLYVIVSRIRIHMIPMFPQMLPCD
jgi:hypothetical protein